MLFLLFVYIYHYNKSLLSTGFSWKDFQTSQCVCPFRAKENMMIIIKYPIHNNIIS